MTKLYGLWMLSQPWLNNVVIYNFQCTKALEITYTHSKREKAKKKKNAKARNSFGLDLFLENSF